MSAVPHSGRKGLTCQHRMAQRNGRCLHDKSSWCPYLQACLDNRSILGIDERTPITQWPSYCRMRIESCSRHQGLTLRIHQGLAHILPDRYVPCRVGYTSLCIRPRFAALLAHSQADTWHLKAQDLAAWHSKYHPLWFCHNGATDICQPTKEAYMLSCFPTYNLVVCLPDTSMPV